MVALGFHEKNGMLGRSRFQDTIGPETGLLEFMGTKTVGRPGWFLTEEFKEKFWFFLEEAVKKGICFHGSIDRF